MKSGLMRGSGLLHLEHRAHAPLPARVHVDHGVGWWLREIIEIERLVGVVMARLVRLRLVYCGGQILPASQVLEVMPTKALALEKQKMCQWWC